MNLKISIEGFKTYLSIRKYVCSFCSLETKEELKDYTNKMFFDFIQTGKAVIPAEKNITKKDIVLEIGD